MKAFIDRQARSGRTATAPILEPASADLTALVAEALGRARDVRTILHTSVIPALPPGRRTFALQLQRRLNAEEIFDAALVTSLENEIHALERLVAAETHYGWEADENHVRGGYEVLAHRTEVGNEVASGVRMLTALRQAILDVLDAVAAHRAVEDLLLE